jgi:hypothetical protein
MRSAEKKREDVLSQIARICLIFCSSCDTIELISTDGRYPYEKSHFV